MSNPSSTFTWWCCKCGTKNSYIHTGAHKRHSTSICAECDRRVSWKKPTHRWRTPMPWQTHTKCATCHVALEQDMQKSLASWRYVHKFPRGTKEKDHWGRWCACGKCVCECKWMVNPPENLWGKMKR